MGGAHKKKTDRICMAYSDAEMAILRANYATLGSAGCLELLPARGLGSISNKAVRMGLMARKMRFSTDLERFEVKFFVTPGCWIWTGNLNNKGYGVFAVGGKNVSAHRYAYAQYVGPIGAGLSACHRCDNPKCVNPDHLFLGTHLENMVDRDSKGRCVNLRGTENGMSKLDDAKVRQIRASSGTTGALAREFGVSTSVVWAVRSRKTWKHVADAKVAP